jgi:hypothetical protein
MLGSVSTRRRVTITVATALALLLAVTGVSVARALTAPGTDTVAARLAEWARGHGLSSVVDQLERATYQAPKVGGRPNGSSPLSGTTRVALDRGTLAPITPIASPALPGEGTWHLLSSVGGHPAMQVAYLRPDAVHTSYTAAAVWMDPRLLRFVLHPGTEEPGGGPWPVGHQISPAERPSLAAAFNGGFRLDAARGGFYEGGRTAGKLRTGAASLVFWKDGHASVGAWGRDVQLGPKVAAVRQNLALVVDGGQVVPGLDSNTGGRWGFTLGNKLFVWRSGIGETASGTLVYVAGNRLSAGTLGELLRRAGAVRAMELDINPEWTSFVLYPDAKNLLPDMQHTPHRYDTTSTRDFVTVLRRAG